MDNDLKQYNLSREAASKLLKVSIRTLDRYVKSKKVSSQIVDGRIWLDKGEVDGFSRAKGEVVTVDNIDVSTPGVSIDVDMDNVDSIDKNRQEPVDILTTKRRSKESGGGPYKTLFNDLKEELREKQERLEIANYRVGQLETQVRNSIPMLEYHRENFEKNKKQEELEDKIKQSTGLIKQLSNRVKTESFSKRAFLFFLLIILALQPLWFFFISFE